MSVISEMIRFFGIILKISIQDLNLGGYNAYWDKELKVHAGKNYKVKLNGILPCAREAMAKYRFKQIRAAF